MQAENVPGLTLSTLPPQALPVRPDWRDRLREHLLRLGPETRLNRFLGWTSDAAIAKYVARTAPATLIEARLGERLCGMAELHIRRGIGAALFDAAVAEARRRGVWEIWIFYLTTNLAIRKISERAGFTRIEDADPAMVSAHLGRPPAGTAEAAWQGAPAPDLPN